MKYTRAILHTNTWASVRKQMMRSSFSQAFCVFDYAAYIIVRFPAVPQRASYPQKACKTNSTGKIKIINFIVW